MTTAEDYVNSARALIQQATDLLGDDNKAWKAADLISSADDELESAIATIKNARESIYGAAKEL